MTNNKLFERKNIEKMFKGNVYKRKEIVDKGDRALQDHVNIKLRRLYEDPENKYPGDILLIAIKFCFNLDIPIPDWVKEEFLICHQAYDALDGNADTKTPLVSAFRTDPKIGNHRGQKRQKNQIRYLVWQGVNKLHKEGHPIDEHIFSKVGEEHGISGSTVRDMYYEIVKFTKK